MLICVHSKCGVDRYEEDAETCTDYENDLWSLARHHAAMCHSNET